MLSAILGNNRFGLLLLLSVVCIAAATPASAAEKREPTRRWKITCTYVNSAPDDPIVFPNMPGASHMHDFYGSVGIDASTTTVADLESFASNCPDQDRSAYWTPSLYRNGNKITPQTLLVYYENKSLAAGPLRAFPAGFKFVLGSPVANDIASTEQHLIWACEPEVGKDKTQYGHLPPKTCATGGIQLRMEFPNCWDGKLEADGNAAGHMAFANGLAPAGRGEPVPDPALNTCPAGYPIALPMMRMVVRYQTGVEVGDITLASGSPYSKHSDFFNGWDHDTFQALIDKCLNTPNVACKQLRGTTPAPATSLHTVVTQFKRFVRTEWAKLFVSRDDILALTSKNICRGGAPVLAKL